ncbi:MAG TPA: hypothetical protein VFE62_28290, partial [Gemmataceae bacterium]|nr:hypothetical protein [Gemmataceae bacterium]
MSLPTPAWLTRAADGIRALADRPWLLFLLLLALNALARPYYNCVHDARLYSLQVLNQAEEGAFADDVFLRHGSQDQFSIFSRAVAPLAAAVGVRTAFFLLFLVFNTYFIWALFQLTRRLFADPVLSTCALIFMVTTDLFYGGHGIFSVQEAFFTPRLMATALVLHAIDRIVAHRFWVAMPLLGLALAIHPLMAFGGVLIWVGYVSWSLCGPRFFAAGFVGCCALTAVLLAIPSISSRIFGRMDDDWHAMVRTTVLYNYPDAWSALDWLNHAVALGLGITAFAWLFRGDALRAPFFLIVTLVAILGVAMTTLASMSPYALLFQGQPYRVVWILKVLQVPLGFLVIARCVPMNALAPRLVALALAAYFIVYSYAVNEMILFAFALPIAWCIWRFVPETPRADWWFWGAITTMLLGAGGWMIYRWGFIWVQRATIFEMHDRVDFLRLLAQCVPPALWLLGAVALLQNISSAASERSLRFASLVLALGIPTLYFALDANVQTRSLLTRHGADIAFARNVMADRQHNGHKLPTVYSSLGRVEYVWLDLHAVSYFDVVQTAGVMFNRKTALELQRRIDVVAAFEMSRLRKEKLFMNDDAKAVIERMFKKSFDGPPPTEADLVRLCAEPGLDYVIIPQEFPGLYSASNGRIFVYECDKVIKTSPLSV